MNTNDPLYIKEKINIKEVDGLNIKSAIKQNVHNKDIPR